MKYYMIFLLSGKVVDIASFDEEESRDETVKLWQYQLENCHQNGYDEIQILNQVN